MNDDEIKLVKAGAEAAVKPFANLIETLFGGAAEEYGGMWKDGVAARRRIRHVKLMEKTQVIIEKRKIEPKQIPDYIWMPALIEIGQAGRSLLRRFVEHHSSWPYLAGRVNQQTGQSTRKR